jgi:hypothetical protein
MYRDVEGVAEDWGTRGSGTPSKRIADGVFQMVTDAGAPNLTTVEVETPEDALVLIIEAKVFELKYPFDDDDIQDKINAFLDGEPGDR